MKLDSGLEVKRYKELQLEQSAGLISDLVCQPTEQIFAYDILICEYTIDFSYKRNGRYVFEECKGHFHEMHRLRFKLFLAKQTRLGNEVYLQDTKRHAGTMLRVQLHEGRIMYWENGKWHSWKFSNPKPKNFKSRKSPYTTRARAWKQVRKNFSKG